jgi:glucosamine-6-phosphate deaminase
MFPESIKVQLLNYRFDFGFDPAEELSTAMPSEPILESSREGAKILVFDDPLAACSTAAERIAATIRDRASDRRKAVLGLATGSTPEPVYERLVAIHKLEALSFENVVSYNLDEYYPISPFDRNSYRLYMHQKLFSLVDVRPESVHVLDGTIPEGFVKEAAAAYDRWIEADGGIDLQLLGIGRNGHIGFNEPSDLTIEQAIELPTRRVSLHPTTIADAARSFGGEEKVIRGAITMGIKTILAARSIIILAFGSSKENAVREAILGPITPALPASLLRTRKADTTWLVDRAAARSIVDELSR